MATVQQVQAAYPVQCEGVDDAVIEALIPHAQEMIQHTILAPYSSTHVPTNDVIERAVVHQVGSWLETGDSADVAGWGEGTTVSVGDTEIPVGQEVAPRALRVLRMAGLLTPFGA